MSICCVLGCPGPRQDHEYYFEFPTSRLLRRKWLDALNTPKVAMDSRICCRHFPEQDYELIRGKMRLRSKVVPSLFVGAQVKNNETASKVSSTVTSDSSKIQTNEPSDTQNELTLNKSEQHNHDKNKIGLDSESGISEKVNEQTIDINEEKREECARLASESEKRNVDNEISDQKLGDNEKNCQKDVDRKISDEKDVDDKISDQKDVDNVISDQKNVDNGISNQKDVDKSTSNVTDGNLLEKSDLNTDNGQKPEKNSRKRSGDGSGKDKSVFRKTRFKITPRRVVRSPVDVSDDSINSVDSVQSLPSQPDPKEDIEGILTHYYIENKKTERQVAAMADALHQELERQCDNINSVSDTVNIVSETVNSVADPVFIELSCGQGTDQTSQANDCLMVLESVQCEIDPSMILASRDMDENDNSCEKVEVDDDDDDEVTAVETKKPDPISLLTSSDEDDVIIQEPKIDTVEVSSANTDEDDIPLVSLVKKRKSKSSIIKKILWGGNDFYCVKCRFTTYNAKEYATHMGTHSKIIHICSECGYTTCSKHQLNRHKQKHKNDKRFKCNKCKYSAKHSMSLVYHMRTHKKTASPIKVRRVSDKKYTCNSCDYTTNRSNDLKRHLRRRHKEYDGDDEDYCP